jgi:hypothetical protein
MAEKRSSIGLKSGEYGGKNSQRILLVSLSVLKNLKYKRNNTYRDSMRFLYICMLVDTTVIHHDH